LLSVIDRFLRSRSAICRIVSALGSRPRLSIDSIHWTSVDSSIELSLRFVGLELDRATRPLTRS
jgi:hypothetical protein